MGFIYFTSTPGPFSSKEKGSFSKEPLSWQERDRDGPPRGKVLRQIRIPRTKMLQHHERIY